MSCAIGAEAILPEYEAARDRLMADLRGALGSWFEDFPENERRWASADPAPSTLVAEISEALRQGAGGWLRETEIRSMPWSFDVTTIGAPVYALHGTDDAWELITNVQRIIAAVPTGHLTRIEGATTSRRSSAPRRSPRPSWRCEAEPTPRRLRQWA